MDFQHIPVLFDECINGLNIKEDGVYVDGTVGGGGHSAAIAKHIKTGRLICIDRDPDAVDAAKDRLKEYPYVSVIHGNYMDIPFLLGEIGITGVDGILLDLGVSSFQLDTADRGFSYHNDAPLDMRMSKEGLSAKDIVNDYEEAEIVKILFEYGEEKFSRKIARAIVQQRQIKEIETTLELAEIISHAVPSVYKREKNPSKKTFQALRIAVNGEIENLYTALNNAFDMLNPQGRLAVISFHSLEDRIIKNFNKEKIQGCICPREFPICVCNHKPQGKLINRRAVIASADELEKNRRSRSAKLRIIEKIDTGSHS